jgi:hypothetical protein
MGQKAITQPVCGKSNLNCNRADRLLGEWLTIPNGATRAVMFVTNIIHSTVFINRGDERLE